MNGIKKEVYVLRDALKSKINYVEGNTMIPIELHIADFVLPTDSAAVVYALAVGMTKPKKIVAEVKNNSVIFIPEGDFFKKGINVIQVRIVSKTQTLITFKETVECKEKMNFDDAGEVEKQETLVEQLLAKVSECLGEIKSSEQRITEKVNAEAEIRLLADNNHNKKIGNLEKVYNERIINEEDLKLVTEVGKIVDAILIKKLNEDINTTNESLSDKENPIIMEKIVKTPGITLNAFEGKALSSSALTPPTVEGYKSIGLASGWGDGQIGLLVSPNGWVANCTNVKKTYDSVTLKFLYLKTF